MSSASLERRFPVAAEEYARALRAERSMARGMARLDAPALGAACGIVAGLGLFATTVGKAVLGLRVVGPNGERADWRVATRRWILQLVYLIPVVGWLIGQGGAIVSVIYLFRDPRRQTVYDRVAGSFVVTTASMRGIQA